MKKNRILRMTTSYKTEFYFMCSLYFDCKSLLKDALMCAKEEADTFSLLPTGIQTIGRRW